MGRAVPAWLKSGLSRVEPREQSGRGRRTYGGEPLRAPSTNKKQEENNNNNAKTQNTSYFSHVNNPSLACHLPQTLENERQWLSPSRHHITVVYPPCTRQAPPHTPPFSPHPAIHRLRPSHLFFFYPRRPCTPTPYSRLASTSSPTNTRMSITRADQPPTGMNMTNTAPPEAAAAVPPPPTE